MTRVRGFVESASIFPDIYARSGCRFVFTGTDSLALVLSRNNTLFDRAVTERTTVMPFREYARLTGDDLVHFVRSGGVLFGREERNVRDYIETAIVDNFMGTLFRTRPDRRTARLLDLAFHGGLPDLVHRIFDDRSAHLVSGLLARPFFPENLRNILSDLDATIPVNPFRKELFDGVVTFLGKRFGILEKCPADKDHVSDLDFFLKAIDVFRSFPVIDDGGAVMDDVVFRQPAISAFQIRALISAITLDNDLRHEFSPRELHDFSIPLEKAAFGKMFEDAVIADIADAFPETEDDPRPAVFRYVSRQGGEVDLVIREGDAYHLFEIKSAEKVRTGHLRHLKNRDFLAGFERRIGKIASRNVLCNGEERIREDGIRIFNATRVLIDIPGFFKTLSSARDTPGPSAGSPCP